MVGSGLTREISRMPSKFVEDSQVILLFTHEEEPSLLLPCIGVLHRLSSCCRSLGLGGFSWAHPHHHRVEGGLAPRGVAALESIPSPLTPSAQWRRTLPPAQNNRGSPTCSSR